jgi:uncharacterized protein (DUF2235 family)
MQRNIIVCIDGSGNHPDDADRDDVDTTNVFRLYEALERSERQVVKYFPGVATSGWPIWDKKGMLFGRGADKIRDSAYGFLSAHFRRGDTVSLFGFSRGAAIARDLANHIRDRGIGGEVVVPIRFLGLWDTVGAFGIPMDVLGFPTGRMDLGKKLDVPDNVERTCHLLAIDEQREPFIPTLVDAAPNVEEVWFAGVHADVGGGFPDRELADISLRYMMERAAAEGITFTAQAISQVPLNETGRGEMHPYTGSLIPTKPRKVFVRFRDEAAPTPPKLHRSVRARMENFGYRPANLASLDNYEIVG